jgi:hypothetical protein
MSTLSVTARVADLDLGVSIGADAVEVITAANGVHYEQVKVVNPTERVFTIHTDIGNAGLAVLINRSANKYVDVGFVTGAGNAVLRLLPGQPNVLSLLPATAALYFNAEAGATVPCEVLVREA